MGESDLRVWSRAELGMAQPRGRSTNIYPGRGGVVVHWGGPAQRIDSMRSAAVRWRAWQSMHMSPGGLGTQNGAADVAYTLGFWRHNVLAGRGEGVRTGANGTADANTRYLAIVWLGGEGEIPLESDYETATLLVERLRRGGAGLEVKPHSLFRQTSCPGPDWRGWAAQLDGRRSRPTPTPPGPEPEETTMLEHIMANGQEELAAIAEAIDRNATANEVRSTATRALAAVEGAKHAARVREQYGLDPDPHSDGIQGDRIASGLSLADLGSRLREAAGG